MVTQDAAQRWGAFLLEIERKSLPLYDILTSGNTRKLSEFEEQYVFEKILKYHTSKNPSARGKELLAFKKEFLDARTETPYFVRTMRRPGEQPRINASDAYTAAQKELHEIKKAVIGYRIERANNELPSWHGDFAEKVHDAKLDIDVIDESSELQRKNYFSRLAKKLDKSPLSDIRDDEAAGIRKAVTKLSRGRKISKEAAYQYLKKVENAAGIEHTNEPSDEDVAREAGIQRSYAKDAQRRAEKEKERESYFRGPGIGRDIAEDRGWYRKLKKFFSRE